LGSAVTSDDEVSAAVKGAAEGTAALLKGLTLPLGAAPYLRGGGGGRGVTLATADAGGAESAPNLRLLLLLLTERARPLLFFDAET